MTLMIALPIFNAPSHPVEREIPAYLREAGEDPILGNTMLVPAHQLFTAGNPAFPAVPA